MTSQTAPAQLLATRKVIEESMRAQPLAPGIDLAEIDADGVPLVSLTPAGGWGADILYFHGGGFRLCSARGYASYLSQLAARFSARIFSVDYRLAPENPFPAALTDALTAYEWTLRNGVTPERLAVGGDSAGGGLAASLLIDLRQHGLPSPACAFLLSPWVDLRVVNDSYETCAESDKLFSRASAGDASTAYLAGHSADDPLASPVLADWAGQPPLLVQVSESEVLSDDATNLARAATSAGVLVQHEPFPDQAHVWQMGYPQLPAAVAAVDQIAEFLERHIGAEPSPQSH
jgi:monoterpene epsilon-lactone hydrolase